MVPHFRMLAGYNAWANARLYQAAAALPDADFRADRGAFFKSVLGTLNHLLVTDRIWMKRFIGTGEAPARLDEILFADVSDLRVARTREDERIIAYIDRLDEEDLVGIICYRRVSTPEMIEQALSQALAHVFNHQTHHRGQVHALLTGLSGAAPELDLLVYQRHSGSAR